LSSLRIRALLDTYVFIYAYEILDSNSHIIIGALNQGLFDALITESTFKECYRYIRRYYSKDVADVLRTYMFAACKLILSNQITDLQRYASLVNKKDLEQVAAVRQFGIKYLVSYDEHFQGLKEYDTETIRPDPSTEKASGRLLNIYEERLKSAHVCSYRSISDIS